MFSPGQSLHSADCVRPPTLVTPEQRTLTPRESLIARKATSLESPFTPRQAEQTLSTEEEDPDLVYFPVNLDISELHDWKQGWEDHGQKGELVRVNNTEVAVFRYGEEVVATQARCPHAGGPLHLGDIEVLPDKSLCVKCPWHKWTFCVSGGNGRNITRRKLFGGQERVGGEAEGHCVSPAVARSNGKKVKVFPASVVLNKTRKTIKIGFENFNRKTLFEEPF